MRTMPWLLAVLMISLQSLKAQDSPVISSPLTATAITGRLFNYTISATGSSPITYTATPLPPGMLLAGTNISGTPNTPGITNVLLTASNPAGSDSRTLVITVLEPSFQPMITSPLSAVAAVGRPFSYNITANGTPPITFSALPLPPGLSLNGTVITGIPLLAGISFVTLTATNLVGIDSQSLVLTVITPRDLESLPVITSPTSATATVGSKFRLVLTATGTPPINFTAENIPGGLELRNSTLTGTPNRAGTFEIPITATNRVGSSTQTLKLTVVPEGSVNAAGTWAGNAKGMAFDLSGDNASSRVKDRLSAVFTPSGDTLTATLTFTGKSSTLEFSASGQISNGNFWLAGTTADATNSLVFTGHINKKGNAIAGNAVIHGASEFEELKHTLKKQP